MQQLISRLQACSLTRRDEEWIALHQWAYDYRKDNNITIREFLDILGLEYRSSFLQYLCKTGLKNIPSKREGTMGNLLRCAIRRAKNNEITLRQSESSFEERVQYCMEEYIHQGEHGVENLCIKVTSIDESACVVRLKCSGVSTDNDICSKLGSFISSYLTNMLQRSTSAEVTNFEYLLRAGYSPVCIHVPGSGCGTVTVLNHPKCSDICVALTAKHVIL